MKKQMKWVSGVVATAMTVSMFALPQVTHAQAQKFDRQKGMDLVRKHEAWLEMKSHEAQLLTSLQQVSAAKKAQVNSADVTNATTVTYTGTTNAIQNNYYSFEVVTGGVLTVTANTSNYIIHNLATHQAVTSGQVMDPGFYTLVLPRTDTPFNYSVQLDGVTFNGTPDTSLPTLSTNLTDPSTRLSKDVKSVEVTGSATGFGKLQYWLNGTRQDSTPIPVAADNTFDTTVNVQSGYNKIVLDAEGPTLNGINEVHVFLSPSVERMAGTNRYATSAETSKRMPVVSDTVIIATGKNFPDALSGGPLATWYGAPILLTAPTGLSDEVKQEITRRHATHAIILGGTGVVPTNIETDLQTLGVTQIDRIAGTDRYDTSAKIANTLLNAEQQAFGDHSPEAFIVTGANYADALAASAPAGRYQDPILLVKGTSISTPIQTVINNQQLFFFNIVGGTGVVSTSVENQLNSNGMALRYAGANRFATALVVAQTFTDPNTFTDPSFAMSPSIVHVAYGYNFPDALAQGPLASMMNAPLLLTRTTGLETSVGTFLSNAHPQAAFISGGTGVISTDVENQLDSYIPQ